MGLYVISNLAMGIGNCLVIGRQIAMVVYMKKRNY